MNETLTYSPGDVVTFVDSIVSGRWTILRILADGSLLVRDGNDVRVASPEEVRR